MRLGGAQARLWILYKCLGSLIFFTSNGIFNYCTHCDTIFQFDPQDDGRVLFEGGHFDASAGDWSDQGAATVSS